MEASGHSDGATLGAILRIRTQQSDDNYAANR